MLKTKLESLLEKGFFEMGVEFGERVYGEQIRLYAAMDDVTNSVSVDEYRAQCEALKSGEERLFRDVFAVGELTKNQWHVYRNTVPFFKRTGVVVPYAVSYHAVTAHDYDDYEKMADGLIPRIDLEFIEVEIVNGLPLANLVLGKSIMVSYIDLNDEERLMDYPPGVDARLKYVIPLNKKTYVPEEVCEAVMSFLR